MLLPGFRFEKALVGRGQSELVEALEPSVPGPEVAAEHRSRVAQLVEDLRTLPERRRGALVMRELNGPSYDEIGLALGLTDEAARRAVFDARTALHDAVDGHAAACASVRHSISDGDRRSLRARGIRAHLSSCDDCASFQRSIAARRADLHAFAPWVSGAAVIGALGGGVGSGALLAGGGASAAGGAGVTWGGLPVAVRGLRSRRPWRAPARPQSRSSASRRPTIPPPGRSPHSRNASRCHRRRRARRRRSPPAACPRRATGAGASSPAIARVAPDTPVLLVPGASVAGQTRRRAQAAQSGSEPTRRRGAQTDGRGAARARLARLAERLRRAIADAQALAAGGTQNALSLARSMLQRTVVPLLTSIDRVLAPFGLRLPSSDTATATSGGTGLANLLAPVRGILDSVRQMLQRLYGRR